MTRPAGWYGITWLVTVSRKRPSRFMTRFLSSQLYCVAARNIAKNGRLLWGITLPAPVSTSLLLKRSYRCSCASPSSPVTSPPPPPIWWPRQFSACVDQRRASSEKGSSGKTGIVEKSRWGKAAANSKANTRKVKVWQEWKDQGDLHWTWKSGSPTCKLLLPITLAPEKFSEKKRAVQQCAQGAINRDYFPNVACAMTGK